MSLLDPERFWSHGADRRLDAVRKLRGLDRDVSASPSPRSTALATACALHLGDFEAERDLGVEALEAWAEFQRDFLDGPAAGPLDAAACASRLGRLSEADAGRALALLRRVADLAEESSLRQRQDFWRIDPV